MPTRDEIVAHLTDNYAALNATPAEKQGNISWGSWETYIARLLTLSCPIRTILEIGFNAGHSAAMLCEIFPGAHVLSVDIAANPACAPGKKLLDNFYPGRHTLILEDSRTLLPKLESQFDFIFIDGNHDEGFPQVDLFNCQRLARADTIIVIDDAYGSYSYSVEPHKALMAAKAAGAYNELGAWESDDGKFGFSYGHFAAPFVAIPPQAEPTHPASLSVLIGCYGAFPTYSLRAVRSAISDDRTYAIHVGCNECCAETVAALQQHYADGEIDSLFLSQQNINKDPMMRLLIERTTTDYVLWLDDDSHFVDTSWAQHLNTFIGAHTFDVAGHVHYFHPDAAYGKFRTSRPWWRGDSYFLEPEHATRTWFPTGGLFLARTAYLREHDFPDKLMVKKMDDILLGDMVSQTRGKLINFSHEFMRTVKISDGDRRGSGEQLSDWRFIG